MTIRISRAQVEQTFRVLRECGRGQRECQALLLSAWQDPDRIARVVHSRHQAYGDGFAVERSFLFELWKELRDTKSRIRIQVHTHPGRAFHSKTDDDWPIVQTPGFLSLVIPKFALGRIAFDGTHLAVIEPDGRWGSLDPQEVLEVTP